MHSWFKILASASRVSVFGFVCVCERERESVCVFRVVLLGPYQRQSRFLLARMWRTTFPHNYFRLGWTVPEGARQRAPAFMCQCVHGLHA